MDVDSTCVPTKVWSELLVVYEPQAATGWLLGMNPLLGDRRPIDVLGAGEEPTSSGQSAPSARTCSLKRSAARR